MRKREGQALGPHSAWGFPSECSPFPIFTHPHRLPPARFYLTFPHPTRDFRFSVQKKKHFPSGPFFTSPYRNPPPLPSLLPRVVQDSSPWFSSLLLGREVLIGEAKYYLYPFRISVGTQTKRQLTKREQFINTCGDITQGKPKIKSNSKWW